MEIEEILNKSDQIFEDLLILIVKLSREEKIEKRLKIKEMILKKLTNVILIEDKDFLKLAINLK
uniref:Uncharacterized protein n=1 Tax=candidate division CPR3 bacterium TaxID=2268181 RepID=A0A7C5UVM9_UNCC3